MLAWHATYYYPSPNYWRGKTTKDESSHPLQSPGDLVSPITVNVCFPNNCREYQENVLVSAKGNIEKLETGPHQNIHTRCKPPPYQVTVNP